MFIIQLHYRKPIEEVDQHLNGHVEFLDEQYKEKKFIVSGRKKPRTGGIILSNVATREELEGIIKKDPFYQHQVAEYEIIEFEISKFDERFSPFMN